MRGGGGDRRVVAAAAALSASLRNGRSSEQVMMQLQQKMRRCLHFSGRGILLFSKRVQGGGGAVGNGRQQEILRRTERRLEHEGGGPEVDGRDLGLGLRSLRQSHNSIYVSLKEEDTMRNATTKVLSRSVIGGFLWGSRPRIATESVGSILGEGNVGLRGHFGHHSDWRAGSIRAATFDSTDQPVLGSGASELSSGVTNSSNGDEGSVPTPGTVEATPPTGSGVQGGSRGVEHTSPGPNTFRRWPKQRTNYGQGTRAPISQSSANGSQKVVARIANIPNYIFKSEILSLLKGCNVTPEDVLFFYDSKYRLKFVRLQLPSVESVRLVQRHVAVNGRFGARSAKLTMEAAELDDINKSLAPFRGRSLVMEVNFGVITEDVERFFSGYALDHGHPIKFIRVPYYPVVKSAASGTAKVEFENRVLVRFKTELEALRALREKQGAFCLERRTQLRLIE